MKKITSFRNVPDRLKGASMAIGNFDGVHRGHQAVLAAASHHAREHGRVPAVMAFEPHPRVFFQPHRHLFRLTSLAAKLEMFEILGLKMAAVMNFNNEMAAMSAREFVRKVLVEGFAVSHVVTGYNFFFGKGRDGNPQVLAELGREFGFSTEIVELKGERGERFSSSRVRELLQEGDVRGAANMLGYWWRIKGKVTGGARRGTVMGFPTANIALRNREEFHHGIYAVRVHIEGEVFHGTSYLGTRPTFDDGHPLLETLLFDFDRDIYGREIEIEPIDFIREDIRFRDMEALKAHIARDCEKAREILAQVEKNDPMLAFPLGRARHVQWQGQEL